MAPSSTVPTNYVRRWRVKTPQSDTCSLDTMSSGPRTDPGTRKYNTSCNSCRESRVKCSGGTPCRRCAASNNASVCTYSVSRRRGKRKASEGPQPDHGAQLEAVAQLDHLDMTPFDPIMLNEWADISWPDNPGFNQPSAVDDAGGSTDTSTTFPNPFDHVHIPSPTPPSSSREKCPNLCYASVHSSGKDLIAALKERRPTGLGSNMKLLDEASVHAGSYLDCPLCDTGCTRLLNLAQLHQRQLNLLCDICNNPSRYLTGDSARVALGAYQPSRDDDILLKRILLLGVTRKVRASVDAFQNCVKGFDERHSAGTLELAEAGRLNLVWLLGIAANLVRRLETAKAVLEKDDWGGHLER